jgi:hypothetical protein
VVTHNYNPSTQEAETGRQEFEPVRGLVEGRRGRDRKRRREGERRESPQ